MGSRVKDQTPHHPLLSSLVVRPADSGAGAGGGGNGSDYEPGEVRADPPPNSRSYDHGYRTRAGSVSPVRRRDAHHRHSPGFEPSGGAPRGRGFVNGRDLGRYQDSSPPYSRGRFAGRGFYGSEPFRAEGVPRNSSNVQPREGDWICSDPLCKNLNFARREQCYKCHKSRYGPAGVSRRAYLGPPFPPRHHFSDPPSNHSPGRIANGGGGYRSPPLPRAFPRNGPRDFRSARAPPPRHEGRFHDAPPAIDEYRDRYRRENLFSENRGGYGRREVSPPPPSRGWDGGHQIRKRSRSLVRGGGGAPPRDFHMNRGRDVRRQNGF